MKIAIMTWYTDINYGSLLQAYALSSVLSQKGKTDIIDYHPTRGALVKLSKKEIIIQKIINKEKNILNPNIIVGECALPFKEFIKKYLKTTEPYGDIDEVRKLNDIYDLFVCGSDQIWSPLAFNPHYFLDFVQDRNKMIAYAPSLGVSHFPNPESEHQIGQLIERFEFLSCREKTGCALIKQITGKDAIRVLDPTLLLKEKEWTEAFSLRKKGNIKPYLLAYFLGENKHYWKAVQKLANQLNLEVRIVPVYKKDLHRQGVIERHLDPRQFVELFYNATYICTDSFHGTAFSANFNKPFSCFQRFSNADVNSQNSRVYDFLKLIGMENRLVTKISDLNHDDISFSEANKRLEMCRKESLKFLNTSIDTAISRK